MLKTDVSKIDANIEVWGLGAGMGFVSSSAMCFHVIRPWRCHPGEIGGGFFFYFTGTPSWVLHGYTTHEERQIYPRKKKANVHYRESREYTNVGILQNI